MTAYAARGMEAREWSAAAQASVDHLPLVGRERELGLLVGAVARTPSLALVEGEAGIGKTRLVGELRGSAALAGRRVIFGHCHRLREPFPLGPLIEGLRDVREALAADRTLNSVVGALRPLLPELGPCLPEQLEPLSDPRAQRHRIFRALRELIKAVGPLVCVLEDLHWADDGTLEFLSFLLADPPEHLALVLTYRIEGLDPCHPIFSLGSRAARRVARTKIELGPLSVDEVQVFAATLLEGEDVSHEFASYLRTRGGGIPFAIEELVRLLRQRRVPTDGPRPGAHRKLDKVDEVPDAIRQLVLERIRGLSRDARMMTCAAAVLGRPAPERILRQVAGLPAIRATNGLMEALDAALLEEQEAALYGFRHALAAQAVYEDIGTPRRQRLHLRAARALDSHGEPRPLAQIAHHFHRAGSVRQWVRYAEMAANAAHSAADDRFAVQLLTEALQVSGLPRAVRVRMAAALGTAALYSTRPQAAITALERVLEDEFLPTGVRGELRFSLCRLRFHAGLTAGWREEMSLAVDELGRRPDLAARALVNLAWPRFLGGELAEPLSFLRRAERVVARQDDSVANIAVAAQRAAILLHFGDPAGWNAVADIPKQPRSIDDKLQLLRGYLSLAESAIGIGYYSRVESFLNQADEIQREVGHADLSGRFMCARIFLDYAVGRWEGLTSRANSSDHHIVLASLLLARGELEGALGHAESALEAARSAGSIPGIAAAEGARVRLLLLRGDLQLARRAALEGVDVVRRTGIWVYGTDVVPGAVDALLACRQRDRAIALVREFAGGLFGRDAPAAKAALAGCQGALSEADSRHDAAVRCFSRADHAWRRLPAPYAAAQARSRQARCLLRANDSRGVEVIVGAFEEFERLGASCDAARVRATCRAQGVTLPYPWRGGRRTYGDELSPREVEVARLAGVGMTNSEIAEALVLSRHTVKHHVSSVLRKLELGSRNDLAGIAFDGGASQN